MWGCQQEEGAECQARARERWRQTPGPGSVGHGSKPCPEDEPPAFLGGRFFSREMGPEPCQTYPWAAVSKKGHSGGRGCEMA